MNIVDLNKFPLNQDIFYSYDTATTTILNAPENLSNPFSISISNTYASDIIVRTIIETVTSAVYTQTYNADTKIYSNWVESSGGEDAPQSLSLQATENSMDISISGGNTISLQSADASNAGIITSSEFTILYDLLRLNEFIFAEVPPQQLDWNYQIGQNWYDTVSKLVYVLVGNLQDAAVWQKTTGVGKVNFSEGDKLGFLQDKVLFSDDFIVTPSTTPDDGTVLNISISPVETTFTWITSVVTANSVGALPSTRNIIEEDSLIDIIQLSIDLLNNGNTFIVQNKKIEPVTITLQNGGNIGMVSEVILNPLGLMTFIKDDETNLTFYQ